MPRQSRHRKPSCPRCRTYGDPRLCNCMVSIDRSIAEAMRLIRVGHPTRARGELNAARDIIRKLGLDARKAIRG